mmetsp:Transcript_23885/g.26144  ORF Transcript_23885/g.26144 Transcript_23885/m.26144 type:complete len:121 (-) Transcript_23885:179-541(-)|eukprot:CAMPEP_0173151192 /NCGR_PEP_ID=MMETSP1105-20130129/11427_1 /TAXON_ID=2985 /ORGANISM="Ochromonas sp., Strain BG-1" /LENGTH=120 /DNA_ID=CAMNT_0014066507 /DNA_START=74 /DNA_END=436 /DNA_ORIENTATION=+
MSQYFYPVNDLMMRIGEIEQREMCECFNWGKLSKTFEYDKISEVDGTYREHTFHRKEVELKAEAFNNELVLTFTRLREVKEHESVTEEFTKEWDSIINECTAWITDLFQEVTVVKFAHRK